MDTPQTPTTIEEKPKSSNLGGARPGAGRKPGKMSDHTRARMAAKKLIEEKAMAATDVLIAAQLSLAIGQQFLFKIEKQEIIGPKGGVSYKPLPPKLVTAQWEIEAYLLGLVENGEMHNDNDRSATYYYITTKEPNNMAIDSLHNRVHGRPKETIDLGVDVKFSLKRLSDMRSGKILDEDEQEELDAQQQEVIDAHATEVEIPKQAEIIEVVTAETP